VHLEGWVNTDSFETNSADSAWNTSYPYPLPDASCQLIYNEHFLEHVPADVARRLWRIVISSLFLATCGVWRCPR
jgi:predicted SAM-dependent methyltransferase